VGPWSQHARRPFIPDPLLAQTQGTVCSRSKKTSTRPASGTLSVPRTRMFGLNPAMSLRRFAASPGAGEHAVQAAQDRERQDDVLVLAAPEGVADQIRDTPEESWL
jgi:hypothetical protein